MKIFLLILTIAPLFTSAQISTYQNIDSLKYVSAMPIMNEGNGESSCGDKIFWNVVRKKEAAIPFLIRKLSDTTTTKAPVTYFGGNWTVADVAYNALEEIVNGIPTFELMKRKFDKKGCGYCVYWNHLRGSYNNRIKFQLAVKKWFKKNQHNFVWVSSDKYLTCECAGKHPNGGHFELRSKK
jgi:hypothetical protein